MKILLDEAELRVMKNISDKVGKITIDQDGYIDKDELIGILWDLNDAYDDLEDRYREFEMDVQDNYKQITQAEQYGISDREFI